MILCFGYCNNGEAIADLILILNEAFPKENTVVLKMFNKVNSAVRRVCKSQFERNYTCVCLNQPKYAMVEEATMMIGSGDSGGDVDSESQSQKLLYK